MSPPQAREFPLQARESPLPAREFPPQAREFPLPVSEFRVQAPDFRVQAREFALRALEFRVRARVSPLRAPEFWVQARVSPVQARVSSARVVEFPVREVLGSALGLWTKPRPSASLSTDLPELSTDLAVSIETCAQCEIVDTCSHYPKVYTGHTPVSNSTVC
ncbi:hypothetical protein Atai01_50800 [Amycolatopsis taiwanensis]|uniref:Uncharacterized protein n=1 Tax=Amycolatopsis taiwanensis TaxID=342230 RepID=A0A9W6R411_9PSEU|nr:hypothetical protein Atai01_50800 [Amycolatopsis taiwanensis]